MSWLILIATLTVVWFTGDRFARHKVLRRRARLRAFADGLGLQFIPSGGIGPDDLVRGELDGFGVFLSHQERPGAHPTLRLEVAGVPMPDALLVLPRPGRSDDRTGDVGFDRNLMVRTLDAAARGALNSKVRAALSELVLLTSDIGVGENSIRIAHRGRSRPWERAGWLEVRTECMLAAARALRAVPREPVEALVRVAQADPGFGVRELALRELRGASEAHAREVAAEVVAADHDAAVTVRSAESLAYARLLIEAIDLLGEGGRRALVWLVGTKLVPRFQRRAALTKLLSLVRDPETQALLERLVADESDELRGDAAVALERKGGALALVEVAERGELSLTPDAGALSVAERDRRREPGRDA